MEVIYLKDKNYLSRRWKECETEDGAFFFKDTVKKLTEKKTECLVCLRTNSHDLVTSVMIQTDDKTDQNKKP